jgi:hypothetical protein
LDELLDVYRERVSICVWREKRSRFFFPAKKLRNAPWEVVLSRSSYYERSPLKYSFPTSRLTQEREKFKYRRATYKIRRRDFFLSYESLKSRKRRIFFQRATYKVTYVEAVECRQRGLSPQEGDVRRFKKRKRPRKARRWLREGKVPCVLNQEISFFGSRVFGF